MTRLRSLAATALATAALVTVLPATAFAGPPVQNPPVNVDVAQMAKTIENLLGSSGGNVVGYAYAIAKNGKYAAGKAIGQARTTADSNPRSFAMNSKLDVASSTKNFMAAATLKLLEANKLTPSTGVLPYLPASWTKGNGWANVRFQDLLAHTSGLGQMGAALSPQQQNQFWTTVYSGVQWAVGRTITAPAGYVYSNMNYATLRVILPRLWALAEPARGVPAVTSTNSGTWALAYLNEKLLVPAGIGNAACQPASAAIAPLAYDVSQAPVQGQLFQLTGASAEACAGHRGLHLSVMDLLRFEVHLRHGSIVSGQVRFWMDTLRLGWMPASNTGNNAGMYFHAGDLFANTANSGNTNPGNLPPGAPNQQSHTCVAKFPGGVEATLVMNSQAQNGRLPCPTLLTAFRSAD